MAFPTSSLTNNQVHKEGNRAFVYDSALGVWDQVRETDRTENKILSGEISGGTIGSGVALPVGSVVQVVEFQGTGASHNHTTSGSWVSVGGGGFKPSITITAGNKIAFSGSFMIAAYNGGADVGCNLRVVDSTNNDTIINPNGDSSIAYLNVNSSSGNELDVQIKISRLYTPAAGTTINFDTLTRANWGGTVQFNCQASSVVMMEIQT